MSAATPAIESRLLAEAFEASGLTETELASAAGVSVGAVRIALSGVRYHHGKHLVASSPDYIVTRLSWVLGVDETALREVGRIRAAQLLEAMKLTADITYVAV